jgi:L-threonylcarbamoyladenylate synthase
MEYEEFERTLAAVRDGGVVVYPTETLYALGCDACNEAAAERVVSIKGRPQGKPLPVVIGDRAQLSQVVGEWPELAQQLLEVFWPGPLSILVPAAPGLAPQVSAGTGLVSVRQTPHPLAARLSMRAKAPLIATSANRSGFPPAAHPEEVDREVAAAADAVLDIRPWPAGSAPSTLVRIRGSRLEIMREGAIGADVLSSRGFVVELGKNS